jgi:hypothetical protein
VLGNVGEPVAYEHVEVGVRAPAVEGRGGREGHVAAVGSDGTAARAELALLTVARDADPLGGAGEPVADKGVDLAVGVVGNQVVGVGGENDVPAVRAEVGRTIGRGAVAVHLCAADVDLLGHSDGVHRRSGCRQHEQRGGAEHQHADLS